MRRAVLIAALVALPLLGGCDSLWEDGGDRIDTAREFPPADRPVAPITSTKWSTEEARDRVNEAEDVMDSADVRPGMTVADIGAGDGYYTVRLAPRVGASGRVLAQDIIPEVIDRLADRVTRERLDNVSLKLGAVDDPRLPSNSFDRVFMVHMYHEIEEPYAFLWRLRPALRAGGQVIVVDGDRPIAEHGTPFRLLVCEFEAVGYKLVSYDDKQHAGGYLARFVPDGQRPEPDDIKVCKNP
ncbi:class I SAM-dependent methyltransferase [Sphingopyxis sp. XHP0097]|jgi:SAM-dependent methyltransferase|uniref:Class I SAM-dependent methyltransferase n=1 Tax=Sphingopyxis jiangsuensis TaxID=2871171 RepID=A0ABS7MFM0_9SPHN|nr:MULTISPECIES: class I SAM-dependent methyltransferase [Sphingopyxis]MBL0769316.1 class I SAM-dependent methyltransferase [Sphingopyxis lutea]MBY4637577.1 class I SAM-dependent methyltransferase [Sphingopyxis jiangsuensis]